MRNETKAHQAQEINQEFEASLYRLNADMGISCDQILLTSGSHALILRIIILFLTLNAWEILLIVFAMLQLFAESLGQLEIKFKYKIIFSQAFFPLGPEWCSAAQLASSSNGSRPLLVRFDRFGRVDLNCNSQSLIQLWCWLKKSQFERQWFSFSVSMNLTFMIWLPSNTRILSLPIPSSLIPINQKLYLKVYRGRWWVGSELSTKRFMVYAAFPNGGAASSHLSDAIGRGASTD